MCNAIAMPDLQTLIGTAAVARRLDIDKTTVTRMVADGRLTPVAKLPAKNGAFLFDAIAVEQLASTMAAVGAARAGGAS